MTVGEVIVSGAATFGFSLLLAFLIDIRNKLTKVCLIVSRLQRGDEEHTKAIDRIESNCPYCEPGAQSARKHTKSIRQTATARV